MKADPKAVVIGASAGALEALSAILPSLSADFRLPIMIVVHVPPDKRSVLAELFKAKCRLSAIEVEDKQPIVAATAYFAPPDYHLLVETETSLALSTEEPVLFSRPSIDVLFQSAAEVFGAGLVAIVLTGANEDGARGLKAVAQAGGTTIVQDPSEAFQGAMPLAAIGAVPDARVLPLASITEYLQRFEP